MSIDTRLQIEKQLQREKTTEIERSIERNNSKEIGRKTIAERENSRNQKIVKEKQFHKKSEDKQLKREKATEIGRSLERETILKEIGRETIAERESSRNQKIVRERNNF